MPTDTNPPISTLSTWARALIDALDSAGHAPDVVIAATGFDAARLNEPQARYRIDELDPLWAYGCRHCGPGFGLQVGRHIVLGHLQTVGVAMTTISSVEEGLVNFAKYASLVSSVLDLRLRSKGERLYLDVAYQLSVPHLNERLEAVMAQCLSVVQLVMGRRPADIEVSLLRAQPADPAPWVGVFGGNIHWGADSAGMSMNRKEATRVVNLIDPALREHHLRLLDTQLQQWQRADPTADIRRAIRHSLREGEPSLQRIAEQLHTSVRSLQRSLHSADTSFRALLDQVRAELARGYLAQGKSKSEVAFLLGYSNTTAFHRAFKRWESTD